MSKIKPNTIWTHVENKKQYKVHGVVMSKQPHGWVESVFYSPVHKVENRFKFCVRTKPNFLARFSEVKN